MAVQGPRKGESSYDSMRYGFRTQPARLVRGSSRRIMTMRFRPANIRVINRRVCSWAVIGPAVQNQRSKLTSRIVIPPSRPSKAWSMPERCSPSRVRFAAPNCGAPLTAPLRSGQTLIATGGSGGITRQPAPKTKAGVPPVGRNAGRNQNPSNLEGLDKVAPYQKRYCRAGSDGSG
jgi:hypothetical protein